MKTVSFSWNLVPRLIEYADFSGRIHFFCFRLEIPFSCKLFKKIKISSLNWNFVSRLINLKIKNLMLMFIFSVFFSKSSFWENFVPKFKVIFLKWSLLSIIFRILKIQCNVHFFSFWPQILSLGKIGPKYKNYHFRRKFVSYTYSKLQNLIVEFAFSDFDCKYLFWQIWSKKSKLLG